jgi:DNA polymerase III subunit delta'
MPFRDITGHAHIHELLARAALRGSLPPSLIFAGPEGVGKRMTAVALAQLLNCLAIGGTDAGSLFESVEPSDAPAGDACGVCASCKRIARGVHADVLEIEPGDSGSIKVEQVRDAIERSAYRPFEGRRRVVIIDGADALVVSAQDALLKTLEEPPPASVFVLVTSRPDVLLPTVRSRCQRLRFGRLAPADVVAVLTTRHQYSAVDASAAAALSDGSVGAALEGSAEGFVDAREAAAGLLESVAASDDPRRRLAGAKALSGAARGGSDREELARRLHALSSILRDLGVLLSRADERSLANADLRPLLERLQRSFDGERALRAFSAVDRALSALERNASPKIVADWLAFQI